MNVSQRIHAIINEYSLLKHPFYKDWNEGRLSKDVLRHYAGQYFALVDAFPRFVSSVHSHCPDIDVRKALVHNLADEEIGAVDHPEMWLRFAEGLGAERERIRHECLLPETSAMLTTFFKLTAGDWKAGLCALYAYEVQVPEVSASKIDGLKQHYGIEDDRTLQFFAAHLKYDVEHSGAIAALLDQHVTLEEGEHAARQAAASQWAFLDGIMRDTNAAKMRHEVASA